MTMGLQAITVEVDCTAVGPIEQIAVAWIHSHARECFLNDAGALTPTVVWQKPVGSEMAAESLVQPAVIEDFVG